MVATTKNSALLLLEQGHIFEGYSIGIAGVSTGELVFNTSMTGYQEILTDPSYTGQLVALTYPHIGNTGVNSDDEESSRLWLEGLIIRDLALLPSNFRSEGDLHTYLCNHNIVAIAGVDTRHLTSILRHEGSQKGCLIANDAPYRRDQWLGEAREQLQQSPDLLGRELVSTVSTKEIYEWKQAGWQLGRGYGSLNGNDANRYKIVVIDFGVKRNILRMLVDRQCDVLVVPAKTTAQALLAMSPDGILLSNGPGDPEPCDYAIATIKELLTRGIPLFGICLGYQLLALASNAKTKKMKFGHHGSNHPVKSLDDGKLLITSQNHNFEVDKSSLPSNLRITHISLFDDSIQGIVRTDCPAFGFQGHPEVSPGPHDIMQLFDQFISLIESHKSVSKVPLSAFS